MTVAQAHEFNMWVAFILVGIPVLIVLGGGLLLHMAIALAALALFFSHPVLAIALAVLWWFPWRWLVAGFAVGEGLKLSGVFGRLHRRRRRYPTRRAWTRDELDRADREDRRGPPRAVGRRPDQYQPFDFDDTIDIG